MLISNFSHLTNIENNCITKSFNSLGKYFSNSCFLEQPFVKDPDKKVGELVKAAGSEVISFYRLEVGEGIEIKEEDFAAEVAAQLKESQ